MPDIVDALTRSRMMAGIRAKNTTPEMLVRRSLHALGYRYRIHSDHVPGKPDMVFPRYRAAIFVHGCFWHGHDCPLFRLPGTRSDFWRNKIVQNVRRDSIVREQVLAAGWRHFTVWECSMRGRSSLGLQQTIKRTVRWLEGTQKAGQVRGVR